MHRKWRDGKRKAHLSTTSSILRSAASYQLRVMILYQVLVESHVLFFGQYGIVGFETIFLKQSIVTKPRNARLAPFFICSLLNFWLTRRLGYLEEDFPSREARSYRY